MKSHNYHFHVSCLTGKEDLPQHYREKTHLHMFALSDTIRFDPDCEPQLDE